MQNAVWIPLYFTQRCTNISNLYKRCIVMSSGEYTQFIVTSYVGGKEGEGRRERACHVVEVVQHILEFSLLEDINFNSGRAVN